ncbi:MAG TPA: hypothetical protein VL551_20410 [Actinospica sp.]|nr:hypothetical protein [Actinospica sp.]
MEQIVEHARTMARRARQSGSDGWKHGSLHDVVLAYGRIFEPAPLPENVYPALPGHASKAAAILADQHAFTYVEGLALLPDMHTVIEHAWCATFTGQVIDPNLSGNTAAAYLGVAFTMNFRRTTLAQGAGAILIGNPAGEPPPSTPKSSSTASPPTPSWQSAHRTTTPVPQAANRNGHMDSHAPEREARPPPAPHAPKCTPGTDWRPRPETLADTGAPKGLMRTRRLAHSSRA